MRNNNQSAANSRELIISTYDGCYNCSAFITGIKLTTDEQLNICMSFDFEYNTIKTQQILNKYNIERAIICCDGGIKIIMKNDRGEYVLVYEDIDNQ